MRFFSFSNSSKILAALALAVLPLLAIQPAWAQTEIPSNLQVIGTIAPGNSVLPELNDFVLVVRTSNLGAVEGQGTVIANDGSFFVDMAKTQSFNGTQLTLLLKKASGTYQLNNGNTPLAFPFSGTFPFPSRITFNVAIGQKIGGGGGGGNNNGGGGGTENDTFDVNGDGVFNQADVDAIKSELGAARPSATMDVNSDGLVNTRDAIDAIRALNSSGTSRLQAAPAPDEDEGETE